MKPRTKLANVLSSGQIRHHVGVATVTPTTQAHAPRVPATKMTKKSVLYALGSDSEKLLNGLNGTASPKDYLYRKTCDTHVALPGEKIGRCK